MKHIRPLCVLVIAIVLLSSGTWAKDAHESYGKSFSMEVSGVATGVFRGEYEHRLASDLSLTLMGSFFSLGTEDLNVNLIGGGVGIRKYLVGDVLDGFYVGGYGTYSRSSALFENEATVKSSISIAAIGAQAGFKWVFRDGFTVNVGSEICAPLQAKVDFPEYQDETALRTVTSRLHLGLGISW